MATWPDTESILKKLFGCPTRVLVALWILESDDTPFFQVQAIDALRPYGQAGSKTRSALELFVQLGMLQAMNDGRRRYYTRLDSRLWSPLGAIGESMGLKVRDENGVAARHHA